MTITITASAHTAEIELTDSMIDSIAEEIEEGDIGSSLIVLHAFRQALDSDDPSGEAVEAFSQSFDNRTLASAIENIISWYGDEHESISPHVDQLVGAA